MVDALTKTKITIESRLIDSGHMWFARREEENGWATLIAGNINYQSLVEHLYKKLFP